MRTRFRKLPFSVKAFVFIFLSFLFLPPAFSGESAKRPKYVFLFIGDGTSIPQRTAAEFYLASRESAPDVVSATLRPEQKKSGKSGVAASAPEVKHLIMNTFPAQGLSSTYSASSLITDSAASATAIATGRKTFDGYLGVDTAGQVNFTSVAKIAKASGKKVGILTSVSIDHATPAAFYANQSARSDYYKIAVQGPPTGFDYFAGGGFIQPNGKKGDKKNILEVYREYGYRVSTSLAEFNSLSARDGKVLAINPVLDPSAALPYAIDRAAGSIPLAEFVRKGIEVMDNDAGFFLMTEGGKIDWACHANDALTTIKEVLDFDEAVKAAYEFYKQHPDDTLIVVTGDHETGGMTMGAAVTQYDTYFEFLDGQLGSFEAFNVMVGELKQRHPNATVEDVLPAIREFFGLEFHTSEEAERLTAAAAEGDTAAIRRLKYGLRPFEMEKIRRAVTANWAPSRGKQFDEALYSAYGTYEPLTVTMTHILNNRAGIGWTTFSHTGLPTPVSAIGVGWEEFVGYYDNTDIFRKIVSIAY